MICREKKSNVYQDPDPEEGAVVASTMRKVRILLTTTNDNKNNNRTASEYFVGVCFCMIVRE